jgi:hypothetical protein
MSLSGSSQGRRFATILHTTGITRYTIMSCDLWRQHVEYAQCKLAPSNTAALMAPNALLRAQSFHTCQHMQTLCVIPACAATRRTGPPSSIGPNTRLSSLQMGATLMRACPIHHAMHGRHPQKRTIITNISIRTTHRASSRATRAPVHCLRAVAAGVCDPEPAKQGMPSGRHAVVMLFQMRST